VALVAVPLYAVNQRFFFAHLRKLSDEIRAQVSALYALLSERVSDLLICGQISFRGLSLIPGGG